MNLHLAVVLDCWNTGCRVLPLESNQPLDAVYADPMVDFGILVRPKDLVAVDFGTTPPRIVFRWMLTSIVKIEDRQVYTLEGDIQPDRMADYLHVPLIEEDDVYIANGLVCDRAENEQPMHPDILCQEFYPQIEEMYRRMDQYLALDPKQVVREGYGQIAGHYLERMQDVRAEERARYTSFLLDNVPPGSAVLEIGCGSGVLTTKDLAEKFHLTGVDISAEQIALAKQNVPQAEFIMADITRVDFNPESFDAVAAFYSLIHIPRDEQVPLIKKIYGWLRLGGYFVAAMGTHPARQEYDEDFLGARMYWSSFDSRTNVDLVKQAGFTIQSALEETAPEFGQPVTFLWIIARKA